MVRLRRDRWYSADGQGRSRAVVGTRVSGTRRLISLCFLLALVIFLMNKAADPRHVSRAFRALGVPLETASGANRAEIAANGAASTKLPASRWLITCQDLVPQLLDEASNASILALGSAWFTEVAVADDDLRTLRSLRQESFAGLELLGNQLSAQDEVWRDELARFQQEWKTLWARQLLPEALPSGTAPEEVGQELVSTELASSLTAYLDRRLTLSMKNAKPWTSSEKLGFWRLLQRGQGRGRANSADQMGRPAPAISTLQLESEAEVYQATNIRFRGSVRRVEAVPRQHPGFDIDGYWLIWVRGADDSTQPVAIYTTNHQAEQFAERLKQNQTEFPEIEVLGVVGKRLAYNSAAGIQVAPTIFATRLAEQRITSLPAVAEPARMEKDLPRALGLGALLAVAVLLPIWAGWRHSSKSARARPGTGKRVWCLWALVMLGNQPAVMAQDNRSPWAATGDADQQRRQLLEARLQDLWKPSILTSWQGYFANQQENIPDSALQLMNVLRQMQFSKLQPALEDAPIRLPTGQLEFVRLSGVVRFAMPVQLSADQQEWFRRDDDDSLFQVNLEPWTPDAPDGQPIPVLCRQIPAAWTSASQLKQPARVDGILIRDPDSSTVCLLADAVDWVVPADKMDDWTPALTSPQRWLAGLGCNLRWLDLLRRHHQQPLSEEESTAFYTFLRQLDPQSTTDAQFTSAATITEPMQVLARQKAFLGQPIRWRVRLVTGSQVRVPHQQDQDVLGSDHYYQFDGMVDIGQQRIRYEIARGDDLVRFEREFPITVVMKQLDAKFAPASAAGPGQRSWEVGQWAEVEGCFFRMWSYQSELIAGRNPDARQAAPLIVARRLTPTTVRLSRSASHEIGWFGVALAAATIIILGSMLFLVFQKEPRRRRVASRK